MVANISNSPGQENTEGMFFLFCCHFESI